MKNLKRLMHNILFPGAFVVIFGVLLSAGLLIYTFLIAGEDSPIAYAAYIISAYSLTIVCTSFFPMVRKGNKWIRKNLYISRYFDDIPFKLRVSLYLSFAVNLLYAGMNAFSGIYYRSVWFGTLAVYYIFLLVMRFLMIRYSQKYGFMKNKAGEWRRYRLCGAILIMMNIALAGVVVLVLHQNRSFQYAGFLIYAMALYIFYITIIAIVNVARYRKYNSPVMSAARAVSLASALVSLLSLETAMLDQFNTGNVSPYFRQIMIGSTGGAICALIVGMGVYMIFHSTRELKKTKNNNLKT